MKISIDRDCGKTLTDQLTDALRSAIYSGKWKCGECLPTREELMAMCGVSRNVVQSAVKRLVSPKGSSSRVPVSAALSQGLRGVPYAASCCTSTPAAAFPTGTHFSRIRCAGR